MKKPEHKILLALAGAILLAGNFFTAIASTPEAAGLEFFESKIRPLLIDNCYKCHSSESEKLKGGLLLDSKDGLLNGGDSGPAIVPGNPETSLLIKAVRYTDANLQMPPKDKKLSAEKIADLEAWVKMGAPDPRTQSAKINSQSPDELAKNHWAFQPVKNFPVPKIKNKSWTKTPIDHFILAKLEEKKLKPSSQADKRTLIRRATFDLTGLPPTADEVENFLNDKSSDAFAKVIDRLLASQRYGERWGRHWLDVARYADTRGYVFEGERRFPYSYTYRDYVIRSFNEDLPYDKFLMQQIAADKLDLGDDKRPLAAMGFLTLNRFFLGNIHDITDDRIDVVTRGTMGFTVACARCHDHKYDPISIKDYYSLYGVFASSHEPNEKPLLGIPAPPDLQKKYEAEKNKREDKVKAFRTEKNAEAYSQLRNRAGEYLLTAWETGDFDKSKAENLARERKLDPGVVNRWKASLTNWSNATNPIFAPWYSFTAIAETNFASEAKGVFDKLPSQKFINPIVASAFTNVPVSLKEVSERYGKIFADTEKLWRDALAAHEKLTNAPALTALPDANQEAVRQILYADDAPANPTDVMKLFDIPASQRLRALQRESDELDATHPGAPARAMSMADNATPINVQVFIRGNPGNRGAEVPRQFLSVLSGGKPEPFKDGSGRLELAQAIANKTNPLTARVIVNRVWLHHFGKGLVTTPSDFGLRSDPPSHPELLDYLAWNFMENGWSLKKLHRQIILSSVYQQSSDAPKTSSLRFEKIPELVDPENRLLWKMNRQRLDFEGLRDSLLMVSGKLDLKMGGQAVDIVSESPTPRRTIYGHIDRQNLPGLFRTFDFANPDTSSPQRFFTTVPQQSLFMLNSSFVVEQAKSLTGNTEFEKISNDETRINFLYERIFQRDPISDELRAANQFLKTQATIESNSSTTPSWQYGFGEYDETKKEVKFSPLPFFQNNQWQASEKFPDPKLGYAMLNPVGGHPGNIPGQSVIRRWTSPLYGVVRVEGTLSHGTNANDGVMGRIISSRSGELGKWIAHNDKVETTVAECEVKPGDTIDFVTDMRTGPGHDTFQWSSKIKVVKVEYGTVAPKRNNWNAQNDFDGPPKPVKSLNAWEKYAQVLLLSNEFMFVD